MNLFSGLEKFGFLGDEDFDILKEDKRKRKSRRAEKKVVKLLEEKDLVLRKLLSAQSVTGVS